MIFRRIKNKRCFFWKYTSINIYIEENFILFIRNDFRCKLIQLLILRISKFNLLIYIYLLIMILDKIYIII